VADSSYAHRASEGPPPEPPEGGVTTTASPAHLDADQSSSPFAMTSYGRGHHYFEQMRVQLRWRLLLAYVVPLLLLSLFFHFWYAHTLEAGIDNHLLATAENRRNTADIFLRERELEVRNVFRLDSFRVPPVSENLDGVLRQLTYQSETFADVGLFAPDGTLVAYAGPYRHLLGTSYADEEWYRQVLEDEGNSTISDVFLGFRGKPHFIIAVVSEIDGQPWTVRASVDPEEFADFVGRELRVPHAEAFIVNRDGRRQTIRSEDDLVAVLDIAHPADEEAATTLIREDGVEYLTAIAPLQATDWFLAVRVPSAQAYAPVRRGRLVLLGLMLSILGVVVMLAFRATQRLVTRLETADVAQERLKLQLFDAAKLASVGEMAAGVAHEINNPLAIIYEEAGILKDTLDPAFGLEVDLDEFGERLDAIVEATLRGRDITRQLMAFARKEEQSIEAVQLDDLVRKSLGVKEQDLRLSNIEVVTELTEDLPPLEADPHRLEQVLLNMLNNAQDAIGSEGRITVRTGLLGDEVRLEVEDTGHGMSAEVMERVFNPFFTTKDVGRGTGLGLSISYGIIKSFGGRIEVESTPGVGTRFVISLPADSHDQR